MSLHSERGSSLVEIAVASAIFSFLVLTLSPSILNTRKAAALSGNSSIASALALDKIEQLRALPSSDGTLTTGTHTDTLNPLRADGTTGGIFTRTWTVTNDTPQFDMKRVVVEVTWRDRIGQQNVDLVTFLLP